MYSEEFAWGWCDLCVTEDFARTGQQYIHLEWTPACVGYCHQHKHRLTNHCTFGAERRPILNLRARVHAWCVASAGDR